MILKASLDDIRNNMKRDEINLIDSYGDVLHLARNEIQNQTHAGHLKDSYIRLIEAVTYCCSMGVEGNIVEFGCWTGRSSVVIAEAIRLFNEKNIESNLNQEKKVYFCDSFAGLPAITTSEDQSNLHVLAGYWDKGAMTWHTAESIDTLIGQILAKEKYKIVPGFFSDTVEKEFQHRKIAMINCDVDLYSSTIDCLYPLFKMESISKGCIILFDDWNNSAANPNLGQRAAFSKICEDFSVEYSDEGSYSYHGHAFIIHDYLKPGQA